MLAAVEDVAGAARAVREQLHDVLERRLVLELGALLRDGLRLRLLDTVALGGVWVRVRSWDLINKIKVFGYIYLAFLTSSSVSRWSLSRYCMALRKSPTSISARSRLYFVVSSWAESVEAVGRVGLWAATTGKDMKGHICTV